jgi:hypothetical protein
MNKEKELQEFEGEFEREEILNKKIKFLISVFASN